jgi:hypothetical protein
VEVAPAARRPADLRAGPLRDRGARELLDEHDLALYAAAKARVLEPGCADWLERGGVF